MRIAVLFEDRCKPHSPAFEYLQKYAGSCGGECIQVDENDKCKILEDACPPCLMRAKNCPGDAVKVINLPEELETDMIATPSKKSCKWCEFRKTEYCSVGV